MTRDSLIQAILQEVVSASEGPDFGGGISPQEFQFQNWVQNTLNRKKKRKIKEEAATKSKKIYVTHLPDARHPPKGSRGTKETLKHYRELRNQSSNTKGLLHHYKHLLRQSTVSEDEDKWLRMKGHIRAAANERGLTGRRRDAYIYGAMRKRGWKPERERVDETVDEFMRAAQKSTLNRRVLKPIKKSYKRNVARPVKGVMRARRYKAEALRQFGQGNWDRALTMDNRANKVLKAHAPALVGAGLGAASGFFIPSPGGTEMGAIIGAKGGQLIRRRRLRPRKETI